MKLLRQFTLILGICCVAELLKYLIPLHIPASIYGLVLMLLALLTGLIRVEQVERAADYFIEIMPVLFVPSAVGLMDSLDAFASMLVPMVLTFSVGTILVMVVTGRVTQALLRRDKTKEAEE